MTATIAGIGVGRENDIVVVDVPRGDAERLVCYLRRQGIYTLPRYDAPGRASLMVVSTLGIDEVGTALVGWEATRN